MEPFFISTVAIASTEFGDKTQLLALLLATRFKKPVPIILGIFFATLFNHAIAAFCGEWIGQHLNGVMLHALLAIFFILGAIWVLKPDRIDPTKENHTNKSVFLTTVIAFFLAEMGDKTQIATALMAAQFQTLVPVILGTTLGILLVNVPVVILGDKIMSYIPIKIIRFISAAIFLLLGLQELLKLVMV